MSVFVIEDDEVDHESLAAGTVSDGGNDSSSSVNARCSRLHAGSSTNEPLSQTGLALDEGEQRNTGHGGREVVASDHPYLSSTHYGNDTLYYHCRR